MFEEPIRTSTNSSTGFASLAFLTGRDSITPTHVAVNGLGEVDETECAEQAGRGEASQEASGDADLASEQYVANRRRVSNLNLPFFLDDEADDGYVAVGSGPKRQRGCRLQTRSASARSPRPK